MFHIKTKSKTRVLGVALGSGGARGWAHVGVLRALKEADVEPDVIAGTSAGAIAAAAYASGNLHVLDDIADSFDWRLIARLFIEFGFPRDGLLTGRRIVKFIKELIPNETFESLRIPTAVVATDLDLEEEFLFTGGADLHLALRASFAIPGVFTPVRHNGRLLADGGLVNPVPVTACRRLGATKVVAVDVNTLQGVSAPEPPAHHDYFSYLEALLTPERLAAFERFIPVERLLRFKRMVKTRRMRRSAAAATAARTQSIFMILTRTIRLYENEISRCHLLQTPPDVLITPPVGHVPTLDFSLARQTIVDGYNAALDAIDKGL